MCQLKSIKRSTGCPPSRSDDGPIVGKSSLFEVLGITDCTKSQKTRLQNLLNDRESFIFEYLLQNRKTILKDKELTWLLATQSTGSSQTSDPESTGAAKDFSPFWNPQCLETSKKLWLPRETDCVASPLSSSNEFFATQGLDSRSSNTLISPLSKSSLMTCSPLSKYFAAEGTEQGGTEVTVMRRVKLNPTANQKKLLSKYADGARFTYNETVAKVNAGAKVNKMTLRNELVTKKDNAFFDGKQWLLNTPKVIRQQAVFEACKNYKACFSNLRAKNISHFKMQFKSRRLKTWTIGIERAVKRGADVKVKEKTQGRVEIFPATLGAFGYYGKLPFEEAPVSDCSIHKDATGRYFLQVPIKKPIHKQKCDVRPVVALDPGVRKFLTGFRSDATACTIGTGFAESLVDVLKTIDAIDSEMSRVDATRRKRLRKKKMLLFQKYKNIRDEFHWKVVNFLTREHSLILLPHLETQRLSQGPKTKANRKMLALGHYTFLQRLKDKCRERNVGLMIVGEECTTKTCSHCGSQATVGTSEVYTCPSCEYTADRDINAARNILLKHMRVVSVKPSALCMLDAYLPQDFQPERFD